jgi:hypothetical protein
MTCTRGQCREWSPEIRERKRSRQRWITGAGPPRTYASSPQFSIPPEKKWEKQPQAPCQSPREENRPTAGRWSSAGHSSGLSRRETSTGWWRTRPRPTRANRSFNSSRTLLRRGMRPAACKVPPLRPSPWHDARGGNGLLDRSPTGRPGDVAIPLKFLGAGKYTAEIYRDAADADQMPQHVTIGKKLVRQADTLTFIWRPAAVALSGLYPPTDCLGWASRLATRNVPISTSF